VGFWYLFWPAKQRMLHINFEVIAVILSPFSSLPGELRVVPETHIQDSGLRSWNAMEVSSLQSVARGREPSQLLLRTSNPLFVRSVSAVILSAVSDTSKAAGRQEQ